MCRSRAKQIAHLKEYVLQPPAPVSEPHLGERLSTTCRDQPLSSKDPFQAFFRSPKASKASEAILEALQALGFPLARVTQPNHTHRHTHLDSQVAIAFFSHCCWFLGGNVHGQKAIATGDPGTHFSRGLQRGGFLFGLL